MIVAAGYLQQARGRVKERVMSSSAMTTIQQKDTLPRSVSSLPADAEMGKYDDGLSAFVRVRARLFGIATACLEVRRKPTMLCKTFGCGGSLQIGAWLRIRPHSWRRQPHDCVSISFSPPTRAAKPTPGHGFPNPWTPAAILHWVQNAERP